jgi:hypothetical protein
VLLSSGFTLLFYFIVRRWMPFAAALFQAAAAVTAEHGLLLGVSLKRPVVESPWSQLTSECQRFGHPPRPAKSQVACVAQPTKTPTQLTKTPRSTDKYAVWTAGGLRRDGGQGDLAAGDGARAVERGLQRPGAVRGAAGVLLGGAGR